MVLRSVRVTNFRCIEECDVELDSRRSLFTGPNASGKTSLLEALFFLGRGRSFRTRRLANVIRQGETEFRVVGRIGDAGAEIVAGVQGDRAGITARLSGRPVANVAELSARFAPQVIDPDVHRLLEEGPVRRRRFMDWGVFHVEQGFLPTWQRYHRALKQRNAALRQNLPDAVVDLWDADLTAAGEALTWMRQQYIDRLRSPFVEVGAAFGMPVDLRFEPGWDLEGTLQVAIGRSRSRDRRLRATQCGPHRSDVAVLVGGVSAKDRVSRGQQKLLAAALTLAQLQLQETDRPGCAALLLDDPAAELDRENLGRLLTVVGRIRCQLVVTSLQTDIQELLQADRVFHVEQGHIRAA
ncbi:MAG: DNA replication/repair protein RecF [Steroidobacteraceae bacterium]